MRTFTAVRGASPVTPTDTVSVPAPPRTQVAPGAAHSTTPDAAGSRTVMSARSTAISHPPGTTLQWKTDPTGAAIPAAVSNVPAAAPGGSRTPSVVYARR